MQYNKNKIIKIQQFLEEKIAFDINNNNNNNNLNLSNNFPFEYVNFFNEKKEEKFKIEFSPLNKSSLSLQPNTNINSDNNTNINSIIPISISDLKNKKKFFYNKLYNDIKFKICNNNKQQRKYHFDSMLKKIKSKTFKTIHLCIKTCYKENFILKRIPQSFITDIKIDSNKILFDKTVKEIYGEHGIVFNFNEEELKLEFLENLEKILDTKLLKIYKLYFDSKQFQRDKKELIRKNNKNFGVLYKLMADIYINYFSSSKGNTSKRTKNIKKFNFKVITKKEKESNK